MDMRKSQFYLGTLTIYPPFTLPRQLQLTFLRFTALPGNSACEARAK